MLTIYYTQLNIDSVTSGTSWHNCHSIYIQESPACILQVGATFIWRECTAIENLNFERRRCSRPSRCI